MACCGKAKRLRALQAERERKKRKRMKNLRKGKLTPSNR